MKRIAIAALLSVSVLGCHHAATVQTTPIAAAPPPATSTPAPAQATDTVVTPASPNVAVDGDLARQCALDVGNVASAPKFAFDDAQLLPEDRDVLAKIATCVTSGPLAGKKLQLVGRADPRGTEEYNLGLGSRRAGMVDDYLTHLGVQPAQLAATTRGATEATGTDEASWTLDRRVDVKLM